MTKDMTVGSPLKLILAFAIPQFIGAMFQQAYHFADIIIVSRILGEGALAAVGSVGPINFLVLGFCIGLSSGLAIPIAQFYGAKDYKTLRQNVGNIFWICLFFGIFFTVIAVVLCRPLLEMTRTPNDIIDMANIYLFVIFLGIPPLLVFNTLTGIMRSLGDSLTPILILIFSSVINIVLVFMLILVFGMGVAGAALATVIAQTLSAISCLIIIKKRYNVLHISKTDFKPDFKHIKKLLAVGVPLGFMFSVMGVGSIFLQTAINSLGSVAVAAVSAASRFEGLFASATGSLGNALVAFCGQNFGAGKIDRIKESIKSSTKIGVFYGLVAFLVVLIFGRQMALLFVEAESEQLLNYTYQYMLIISVFIWALALVHIFRAAIQGMGFGKVVFVTGLLEMIGRGIVGFIFVPAFGFVAVGFAAPAAWILAAAFSIPVFIVTLKTYRLDMEKT